MNPFSILFMQHFLFLAAVIGHVFMWVGVQNRLHSTPVPRPIMKILTLVCFAVIGFVPIIACGWWIAGGRNTIGELYPHELFSPCWIVILIYASLCWLAAAATFIRWIYFRFLRRPPDLMLSHKQSPVAIAPAEAALTADEHRHHIFVHLPKNESLSLDLTEHEITIPRLPHTLDGLTISHISDLHFTGSVGKAYFREMVRVSNELEPDLVAITGDLVDKANCIDWIPDTLGKLTSRYGVYVILGNHDRRVDVKKLRKTLTDCGLIDLGGRWQDIKAHDETIIIGGNELPWFAPAADLRTCPPRTNQAGQLRIILSHSPDQIQWSRANDVDLLLCGHTHGGQIRLPIIGPIFSPSATGVKYDCGLFYLEPTFMHITRGVSGQQPLRWNCPPEIAKLTLRS